MSTTRTANSSPAARPAGRSPQSLRKLNLRLGQGTPGQAFERVAKALDAGKVTVDEARKLGELLERRVRVLDAERVAAELAAIRARADEAARLAGARRLPALPAKRAAEPGVTIDIDSEDGDKYA